MERTLRDINAAAMNSAQRLTIHCEKMSSQASGDLRRNEHVHSVGPPEGRKDKRNSNPDSNRLSLMVNVEVVSVVSRANANLVLDTSNSQSEIGGELYLQARCRIIAAFLKP